MNVQFNGLSFGLIAALAGTVLLVSLGTAFILSIIGRIAGRRRDRDHVHNRSHLGFFRSGLLAAIVLGVVLMVIVKARTVHTVQVRESSELAADVNLSLQEAMHDLSEARQDIRSAVRDVAREIPFEIARIATTPASPGTAVETAGTVTVESSNSQQAVVSAAPGQSQEVPTADVTTVPALSAPPESETDTEELRKRKSELAAHIGQWIQSLRNKSAVENGGGAVEAAQAAESENGDVVVLQLSDQMVEQLLGESGQKLLKSFNSELPGRIRQTYALIPLTPPVDAAVSPVRPLLANGSLEAIANSLVTLVERAESAIPVEQPESAIPVELPSANDAAVALTSAPTVSTIPDWVLKPDGGRTVVETDSLLPGDDSQQPLIGAINSALTEHLSKFTETLDPVLHNQSRFVKLELDRESAEKCIVKTFERHEELETGLGDRQSFRKVYALLEFPESVDNMALQKIRQSLQYDRMAGLGTVVVCVWLSICLAGCSIRMSRNGARLLRVIATPIAGIASLLLLLFAAGFVMALSTVEVPRLPWLQKQKAVQIHLDEAV